MTNTKHANLYEKKNISKPNEILGSVWSLNQNCNKFSNYFIVSLFLAQK